MFLSLSKPALRGNSKVTRMAYQIVTEWGLGKTVGNLAFGSSSGEEDFYKPYSDKTALSIDEEVREMVAEAYVRTKALLEEKREEVSRVASLLLEREAIGRDDMVRMLGERPGGEDRSTFDEILADAGQADDGGAAGGYGNETGEEEAVLEKSSAAEEEGQSKR